MSLDSRSFIPIFYVEVEWKVSLSIWRQLFWKRIPYNSINHWELRGKLRSRLVSTSWAKVESNCSNPWVNTDEFVIPIPSTGWRGWSRAEQKGAGWLDSDKIRSGACYPIVQWSSSRWLQLNTKMAGSTSTLNLLRIWCVLAACWVLTAAQDPTIEVFDLLMPKVHPEKVRVFFVFFTNKLVTRQRSRHKVFADWGFVLEMQPLGETRQLSPNFKWHQLLLSHVTEGTTNHSNSTKSVNSCVRCAGGFGKLHLADNLLTRRVESEI